MNPEDETFLSAFLDGELDPDQRAAIESALVANPVLSEHLRQLSSVHELVASLPRHATRRDLSASVVDRIRRRSARAGRLPRMAVYGTIGGLAAAASVVLALVVGLPSNRLDLRPVVVHSSVVSAPPVFQVEPKDRQAQVGPPATSSILAPAPSSGHSSPAITQTVASRRVGQELDEAGNRIDRVQTSVRDLLDSPDLTHVFIVTDVIGGKATEQINDVVRLSPRIDPAYGRIVVQQGIVIDPRHPNKATVYALVMDEREMTRFRKTLTESFPGAVEESSPDSGVVTRLSNIGDVAVFSGTKATELLNPAEVRLNPPTLAARHEAKTKTSAIGRLGTDEFPELPVREADPLPPASENTAESRTEPERELSAPPATSGAPADPSAPSAVAKADSTAPASVDPHRPRLREGAGRRKASVVLVWVTTPAANTLLRRD